MRGIARLNPETPTPPKPDAAVGAAHDPVAHDSVAAWLNVLTGLLRVPERQARAIRDELEAHLRDRIDDLLLAGRSEAEASRAAIAELGEAAALAARFRGVHAWSRRRRIMNISVLVLAGGAAVMSLVAMNQKGQPAAPFAEYVAAAAPVEPADDLSAVRVTADFRDRRLDEVFEQLGAAAGLPVHVNWSSLADGELAPDTTVTMNVRDMAFERAFGLIAEHVAGESASGPGYRAADGTIWIASRHDIDLAEITLVSYDLTQVVAGIREVGFDERSAGDVVDEIKKTFMELVEPWGWVDNGGDLAMMTSVGHRLFVKAPPRYHEQIRWILGQLPSAGGEEAGVELRVVPTITEDGTEVKLGLEVRPPAGEDGGAAERGAVVPIEADTRAAAPADGSGLLRLYQLRHRSAADLRDLLRAGLPAGAPAGGGPAPRIEADERTNSLLVLGPPLAFESALFEQLDAPAPADGPAPDPAARP